MKNRSNRRILFVSSIPRAVRLFFPLCLVRGWILLSSELCAAMSLGISAWVLSGVSPSGTGHTLQ